MKKQLNKYLTALLLLFSTYGFCQMENSNQTLISRTSVTSFDLRSKELVGSIYINEDFLPAKLSDNQNYYSVRYDAYRDEMEVEKDGNIYYLPKNLNYSINLEGGNKTYQVYKYSEKNEIVTGFFVVLYHGEKISLLLKEKIKLFEEVKSKTGYGDYKPPTLKRLNDEFYIGYEDGSAKVLPSKKKELLNIFESKAGEIESYMKKNKLSFKIKEDLIQIFGYYNTLN